MEFVEQSTKHGSMLTVRPLAAIDESLFSKRELQIMRSLAEEYRDTLAEVMVEATHLETQPWHKIYIEEGKRQQLTPYELALRKQEAEAMLQVIGERVALVKHFAGSCIGART